MGKGVFILVLLACLSSVTCIMVCPPFADFVRSVQHYDEGLRPYGGLLASQDVYRSLCELISSQAPA